MEKTRKIKGDDPKFSSPPAKKRSGRKVHVNGDVWFWGTSWIQGPDGKHYRWHEAWMECGNRSITPSDAVSYIRRVILNERPSLETLNACPPRLTFEQ